MPLIASGVVPVRAIWTLEHVFPMDGSLGEASFHLASAIALRRYDGEDEQAEHQRGRGPREWSPTERARSADCGRWSG